MELGKRTVRGRLRTLLILGRVSNLPTIWSNCLAGWWLGGTGHPGPFLVLTLGASLLYLGGMFLNDAFDADYDRQHRPERPIPSGAISRAAVWQWGFSWLGLGLLSLALLGRPSAVWGLLLAGCILLYDGLHKLVALSPALIAACRGLLVLMAAAAAREGITGLAIWTALVLASYVAGLGALARKEAVQGSLRYWPLLLLSAPIILALIVNRGPYLAPGILLAGSLAAWMVHCLRYAYWADQRNIARSVAGLLAGIVLVDLLAICGGSILVGMAFALLFVSALLLQRVAPAT